MNIIDVITSAAPNKIGMTAVDYFTENNPNGYDTKERVKSFLESIGENNLKKVELGLEYLSEGYCNDNPPIIYDDKTTGLKCIYCQFKLASSNQQLKMVVNDGLVKFMKHCQQGIIKPAFTLTELYNEAIKTI